MSQELLSLCNIFAFLIKLGGSGGSKIMRLNFKIQMLFEKLRNFFTVLVGWIRSFSLREYRFIIRSVFLSIQIIWLNRLCYIYALTFDKIGLPPLFMMRSILFLNWSSLLRR